MSMRRFLTLMLAVALVVTIYPAYCETSTEESFMMDSSFSTYASKWVWLDGKNAEAIIETVVSSFQDKVEPAFVPGCGDCYFAVVNNQRCILVIPYSDSDYYVYSYDLENTDGLMKYAFHEGTKDEEEIEESFKSLEATTYAVRKLENTERFVPEEGGQIKNSKLSMLPNTVNEWLEENSKNKTAKMLIEAVNDHLGTNYELLDGTSFLGTVGSGSDIRLCAMLKISESRWIYCAKTPEYPEYAIITLMDGDDSLMRMAKGSFTRAVDVEPIADISFERGEMNDSSKEDTQPAGFDIMKEVTFSTTKDSLEELMNSHGYEKVKDYDAFVQVTHTLVFYDGKPIFGMPVNTVWYEYTDESYDALSRILIRYKSDVDTFMKVKNSLIDSYGQYQIENTGVSHGNTYVWNYDGLRITLGGALFGETIEDAEKGTAQAQISIVQAESQETNSEDVVTTEQSSTENNAFSVRGISFGMSQEQIKALEKFAFVKADGKLITYTGTLSGIENSNIIYNVDPVEGLLEIQYQYSLPNSSILIKRDYDKIQDALVKKYGEPLGNKNGATHAYTSSPFGAIKDLIPLLGIVEVECEYEEWWIETENGHVKIDHFYMCKDEDKVYNSHYLAYKFVPFDEDQDIINDI